jgi:hypothetical protein
MISGELRKITKKTPQLRLTSPKEAVEEYNLTWFSYKDSVNLSNSIEKNVPFEKKSSREYTMEELSLLW